MLDHERIYLSNILLKDQVSPAFLPYTLHLQTNSLYTVYTRAQIDEPAASCSQISQPQKHTTDESELSQKKHQMADTGDFHYDSFLDPCLIPSSDELVAQGSSFDELYPFDIPGDFADAPQGDAAFDFDFDQHPVQDAVDVDFATTTAPQSSHPDQRYVDPLPQSQTHPSSIWRPLEQPVKQYQYPEPDIFSQNIMAPKPYYPLQPLPSANTMMQHNFGSLTPVGQQFSSIDQPLFMHDNMGPSLAMTDEFGTYEPIPNYQDDGAFNPEDLAFSAASEDLVAVAIREGWTLPGDSTTQAAIQGDLFNPDMCNDSDFDIANAPDSDGDYMPSSSAKAKAPRRNKPSRSRARVQNGSVKKGRPCAKPQTEDRRRINERRMEGYYRRKYDQGNLEKARQQSRESYWRRKQRRVEAGEKVRSYNAPKRAKANKLA